MEKLKKKSLKSIIKKKTKKIIKIYKMTKKYK